MSGLDFLLRKLAADLEPARRVRPRIRVEPGKVTLTQDFDPSPAGPPIADARAAAAANENRDARPHHPDLDAALGFLGGPADSFEASLAIARRGVAGRGGALPHLDRIQAAFGDHDVSGIAAHVGGPAAAAGDAIGAAAYAVDGAVGFGEAPDLFTAAHEAAHIVQQRSGMRGSFDGHDDPADLEAHADAVAARVVAGRSAADLFAGFGGDGAAAGLQRIRIIRSKGSSEWRKADKSENGTLVSTIAELTKERAFVMETEKLDPSERERLIEIISRAGQPELALEVRSDRANPTASYADASEATALLETVTATFKRMTAGVPRAGLDGLKAELTGHRTAIAAAVRQQLVGAAAHGGTVSIREQLDRWGRLIDQALAKITALPSEDGLDGADVPQPPSAEDRASAIATARRVQGYAPLMQGKQWAQGNVNGRLAGEAIAPGEPFGAGAIQLLSKQNLERLQQAVQLTPETQALMARLCALPFTVKHATSAFHSIAGSGLLSSLVDLRQRELAEKASGMSTSKNTEWKGDDGFVFFRFDVGDAAMETRYGPTTIVLDASHVLEDGWVSLHDQLSPLDRPAMRELGHGGRAVRTTKHEETDDGKVDKTRWTHSYPDNPGQEPVTVSFLDEIFHGPDIPTGIALSVILELDRIGGDFRGHAVTLTEPDQLAALVSSLFRIEAKVPLAVPVSSAIKVHAPDGDGRYRRNGLVDPVGMAAGVAFDECTQLATLVRNAEAAAQREATAESRAKHVAIRKSMVKARTEALAKMQAFAKAAKADADKQADDSELADRAALAAALVETRTQELAAAQAAVTKADAT